MNNKQETTSEDFPAKFELLNIEDNSDDSE
jgi:hypothetical protein